MLLQHLWLCKCSGWGSEWGVLRALNRHLKTRRTAGSHGISVCRAVSRLALIILEDTLLQSHISLYISCMCLLWNQGLNAPGFYSWAKVFLTKVPFCFPCTSSSISQVLSAVTKLFLVLLIRASKLLQDRSSQLPPVMLTCCS